MKERRLGSLGWGTLVPFFLPSPVRWREAPGWGSQPGIHLRGDDPSPVSRVARWMGRETAHGLFGSNRFSSPFQQSA